MPRHPPTMPWPSGQPSFETLHFCPVMCRRPHQPGPSIPSPPHTRSPMHSCARTQITRSITRRARATPPIFHKHPIAASAHTVNFFSPPPSPSPLKTPYSCSTNANLVVSSLLQSNVHTFIIARLKSPDNVSRIACLMSSTHCHQYPHRQIRPPHPPVLRAPGLLFNSPFPPSLTCNFTSSRLLHGSCVPAPLTHPGAPAHPLALDTLGTHSLRTVLLPKQHAAAPSPTCINLHFPHTPIGTISAPRAGWLAQGTLGTATCPASTLSFGSECYMNHPS